MKPFRYTRLLILFPLLLAPTLPYPAVARPSGGSDGPIHYLYVVPLSHLDVGFNYSVPEVAELEKQYLDDAIDYAEQYPDYHWTVENVWQLDQWLAQTPDSAQVDRLRTLIAQGKIDVMASYANMHQGLLGSEEFNRFSYPGRVYETNWGLDLDTAISDDVPGSSWALPQILHANGVRNLVAGINTAFGGWPALPVRDTLFNWQGVDGSRVLTWVSTRTYAEGLFSYWLTTAYDDMSFRTQWMVDYYQDNGYAYDSALVMLGFDNDGANTVLDAMDNINRWNQEHTWPQILISTPDAFFEHMRATYGEDRFTTYSGDWSGRWENGETMTPVSTAQNRWIRDIAPQAETLAAIALGLGHTTPYPATGLDQVYRNALIYDEHSDPGGGNELTVAQINTNDQWFRDRVTSSLLTTTQVLRAGLATLANDIQTTQPALVIYNGLSWPRSDLVTLSRSQWAELLASVAAAEDSHSGPGGTVPASLRLIDLATGQPVTTQAVPGRAGLTFLAHDVPALGYRLYGLQRSLGRVRATESETEVPVAQIESEFYRVAVDSSTGDISSIYDKLQARELVDATAATHFNGLVKANQSEAVVWGVTHDVPPGAVHVTSVTGPVFSQLTVTRDQSPLSQTVITLPAGLPRVEIRSILDHDRTEYASHDVQTHWYFVTMPFALGHIGFTGRFQGPNGWLIPQQDWIPGTAHNARVSRHGTDIRAADGFGITLANRESYLSSFGSAGFWDEGQPEAPVLYLNLFARSDEAHTADQGWVAFDTWEPGAPRVYTFSFALTSTSTGFDPTAAEQFSAGFDDPLWVAGLARRSSGPLPGPAGSLLATSQPNVMVTTLKRADYENPDGSNLILRLQETAGQPATSVTVTLPFPLAWAEIDGLGEQRTGAVPLPVDPLLVNLGAYQTLTIRLRSARF